ncbi:lysosomal acid phosphatase-like isoform X1 [Daktulosphaira vitifoliae]|uniref:lysosomal acid phosphatase-like isoform X1 n=2 Tax=Daktulosphaira vitifoliae TaxID=58002 RepID=UPI0021AA1565|nr:lysosomal acid phosphatase-like isoform X1 [Daktulosphaira vitifoliae]
MFLHITYNILVVLAIVDGSIRPAVSSLKFAVVIFRHGDRAPFFNYKLNPYTNFFPEGPYQITKLGKQHMFKKGQIMRRLYDGFLSNLYLDSEIYTKTTNVSRTHMSASMLLTGLYPPTDYQIWSDKKTLWQPIPIYGNSPDHCDGAIGYCPAFESVVEKAYVELFNNSYMTVIDNLLPYLSEKCGQIIDRKNIFGLYDLLTCQKTFGLQLPEWLSQSNYEKIKNYVHGKHFMKVLFGNNRLQNIFAGPLMKEITSLIAEKSKANTTELRKMYLYSGHDLSLGFLANILDNELDVFNFGGSLHFHLYHSKDTFSDIIKVFFFKQWDDDKGIELSMSNCKPPCKVSKFAKMVNEKIPKTRKQECHDL